MEKIKISVLLNSEKSLGELASRKFKLDIAWPLKKLVKRVREELDTYDKIRIDLIKHFGEEQMNDGKGTGTFSVLKANEGEFYKELALVQNKEIELEIPVLKLDDLKGFEMSINDLVNLDWLITE